jgi:hypothetical protein
VCVNAERITDVSTPQTHLGDGVHRHVIGRLRDAPAATAPTAAPVPTAATAPQVPTAAPAPSATTLSQSDALMATIAAAPTSAPTAIVPTSTPLADTNPAKPDDATQGRLRVSNCIAGGSSVDVFVNGKLAVNGGMPQIKLSEAEASGYLYLTPGTYSVAVVPTGKGIDQALIGPLDVPVAAGHRYIVVVLGQKDEQSHTPLVIDETAAYQQAGLSPETWGQITINNVRGTTGVSFLMDEVGTHDVPYGGFAAAVFPAGPVKEFKLSSAVRRSRSSKRMAQHSQCQRAITSIVLPVSFLMNIIPSAAQPRVL